MEVCISKFHVILVNGNLQCAFEMVTFLQVAFTESFLYNFFDAPSGAAFQSTAAAEYVITIFVDNSCDLGSSIETAKIFLAIILLCE